MYTTQDRVDVTQRISEGKTKVFDTSEQAYKHSRIARSYPYPLFKQEKNGKRVQVGYAVPK